jgi:hypothetical protein
MTPRNYSAQEIEQAFNTAGLAGKIPGSMRFVRVGGFCVWRTLGEVGTAHFLFRRGGDPFDAAEGTWRCFLAPRGLGDINTVAQTIQQVEGYYPGSVSYTNNNPGNLKYAGQPGATLGANGFAVFPNYDAGYQALLNQINLDASRGQTIAQFTSIYAPAADNNNPTSYAQTIANAAGLSVNDPLSEAIAGGTGSSSSSASLLGSGNSSVDLSDDDSSTTETVSIFGYDVPITYIALGAAGLLGLFLVMNFED